MNPTSSPSMAAARPDGADDGPAPVSDHASEQGTLGRSSLLNLVGFGVFGLTGFLFIIVITRRLGASGAGTLLTAIAVFNIVARSAMAGTDLALVRFISRFRARGRHGEIGTLYRIALPPVVLVASAAGLAVFSLAGPLGRLLSEDGASADLSQYLRVLAPFIPVAAAYQAVEGGSRGFGTMLPDVVVERVARSAALPVMALAVLAAGGGVTAVALAWAGPFAVALVPIALWSTALLRRAERDLAGRLDRSPGPAPLPVAELRRRFWGFALPRSLAGVFALAITWIDALLLGALEGSEAVGVYTAATRWLIAGNIAGNAVTTAFGPQISALLATEGAAGARRLFQGATAWFVLLAWPAYFTAMAFAPLLVGAFGDGFDEGAAVIAITGVGFLLAAAAGPIDMLLLMAGRSRLSLVNTGIALVVNVGANLLLIPPFGVRGAAVAWALSLIVANGLPLVQMWRLLGIQPFGARSLRALVVAGGAGVVLGLSRLTLGATIPGLAVGLVLGGAVIAVGIGTSPDRMGVGDVLRRSR